MTKVNKSLAKWRERTDANRKWINEYKLQRGCVRCGYKEHPAALDFHHVAPETKSFTICTRLGSERGNLLAEMEKCEVLCANCHRIHTAIEKAKGNQVRKPVDDSQKRFDFELRRIDPCRI